ncbi:hypothetical protein LGR54_10120 [Ancylobacter sp. Lp-2]|uniref:hypothetical protein n=1 Tax=Ancylobacter sp. Lp-2 TaxID=2881339 RepID=UPI001E2E52D5|nr:hypothetical protein [Ancylobacter sp. Lp-2]MCB4768960.1 hypothetical protein [Ancylobacter sp. Lp-2]
MGAIIIGIGLVIGAIGVVVGLIGVQSLAQPSGAALVIVGTLGFVGGLLLLALGFVHRALIDIGLKLDGVVHVEADEYYEGEHARQVAAHDDAHEDYTRAAPAAVTPFEPPARLSEPKAAAQPPEPPVAVLPAEPDVPGPEFPASGVPAPAPAKESSGGLPSWFRRKRAPEPAPVEPAPEPDLAELATDSPELPPFELSDLLEPEPVPVDTKPVDTKPAAAEPRPAMPDFLKPKPPAEPKPAAKPAAPAPEPKIAKPKPPETAPAAADTDEGPGAPPAFLHVSDPTDEPPSEPPGITVLKAGVIGGMAYKLFSDGSIEAELPDGTLRFASLQDLRDHVSGAGPG